MWSKRNGRSPSIPTRERWPRRPLATASPQGWEPGQARMADSLQIRASSRLREGAVGLQPRPSSTFASAAGPQVNGELWVQNGGARGAMPVEPHRPEVDSPGAPRPPGAGPGTPSPAVEARPPDPGERPGRAGFRVAPFGNPPGGRPPEPERGASRTERFPVAPPPRRSPGPGRGPNVRSPRRRAARPAEAPVRVSRPGPSGPHRGGDRPDLRSGAPGARRRPATGGAPAGGRCRSCRSALPFSRAMAAGSGASGAAAGRAGSRSPCRPHGSRC